MTILAPDVGEVLLLRYMLNHSPASNVRMHLYDSNTTPAEDDVLSDYHPGNEVSDVAYTPAVLTGSSWTVATATGTTTATYAQQSFSFSSTQTVYGYYVTSNDDSGLLWAERFDAAPFNIPSGGGTIAINPAIELA